MQIEGLNPALLAMAQYRIKQAAEKQAFVPVGATDPMAAAGGAPPGGDPAAAGGAPPPGAPPMDPAAMGGAPAPAPAAPPPAPAAPAPLPGASPGGAPAPMGAPAPQKIKPEQMMQMLDMRLYNLQQQVTAIMNHLGITLPPGVLVLPPGSTSAPQAETAVPGGPMDPGPVQPPAGGDPAAAGGAPPPGGGAIGTIDPMQGAAPAPKTAGYEFGEAIAELLADEARAESYIGDPVSRISPHAYDDAAGQIEVKAAAVMQMLRSRKQAEARHAA
jgi:hypothetical protein